MTDTTQTVDRLPGFLTLTGWKTSDSLFIRADTVRGIQRFPAIEELTPPIPARTQVRLGKSHHDVAYVQESANVVAGRLQAARDEFAAASEER